MTLQSLLILYGFLALINLVLMIALHFLHDRSGYYKMAAIIWVGIFLAYIADGFVQVQLGDFMHILGIPFIYLMTFGLAKFGSRVYRFEFPQKKLLILFGALWSSGTALYLLGSSFAVSSFVICIGIISPSVYMLIRMWKLRSLSTIDRLLGIIIFVDALHIMDYPFLRLIESTAIWGFSLGLFLVYLISILLPIVINRRLIADLNDQLEIKVQERTEQLLEVREKLVSAAKMSALGEMAGGVAHEINTPLSVIGTISEQAQELLEEEPIDKNQIIKMNQTIHKTVLKISQIVIGLRTFARDGGQDTFVAVPLKQIVENTLALCQEKLKYQRIDITVADIPSEYKIKCREVQISQVLLNLVSNSMDAISHHSDKWIRIDAERSGDNIRLIITDSGKGIPQEVQKKLFQPFFTTKDIGKGTGLGLSISRGIMEMHRGSLKLDTSFINTRFVIECPVAG